MPQYKTYESKDTIKARQVTNKDGEDVVTRDGSFHVHYGDYIVDRDGRVDSVEKDDFEAHFKVPTTRRTAKKTATKKTTSTRKRTRRTAKKTATKKTTSTRKRTR